MQCVSMCLSMPTNLKWSSHLIEFMNVCNNFRLWLFKQGNSMYIIFIEIKQCVEFRKNVLVVTISFFVMYLFQFQIWLVTVLKAINSNQH